MLMSKLPFQVIFSRNMSIRFPHMTHIYMVNNIHVIRMFCPPNLNLKIECLLTIQAIP